MATELEIADVAFRFSCAPGCDLAPDIHPLIPPFLRLSEHPNSLAVRLCANGIPDTSDLHRWRVSPDALTWYRDGDDYLIEHYVPSPVDTVEWLVRFDPRFERDVVVHCGKRFLTAEEGRTLIHNPFGTPLYQLLLTYYLANRHGALHHATGAIIDDRGFLFPGRSGAGKSTLARLLAETETADVLSDDRVFSRRTEGGFHAFGTPWASDADAAWNRRAPLVAICFLHQAGENRIEPIAADAALEQLLPVTAVPWHDPDVIPAVLDYCGELLAHTPCFELHFKPDPSVCGLLREWNPA